MHRKTRVIAAVALAALGLLASLSQSAEAKVKKGPAGLAFYNPPKKLPKQHGTLLWARAADGLVPLADARYTKLVLYSSRTPQGTRDAISGSVSIPRGKPPKGGWPVITYAHGTTGGADICAPSRAAVGSPVAGQTYIDPDLNEWLRHGYAVVRTDYQGLGTPGPHPYLIGESEGRSTLDIVQAARQLDPRIGRRFLIAGHSQGGHAALFAAGEAKSWVPQLRLRGTVAFAPASHILDQAALLPLLTSPSGLTSLAVLIIYGAASQSAQINIPALLSDDVLPFYPLIEQQCLGQLGAPNELGGVPPSKITRSGADTSALNPVLAAMNPLVLSAAPIFIAQGDADTTVFPVFTDRLKDELVGAGDQVIYKKYPGINHVNIPFASEADTVAFFESLIPTGR